MLIIVLFFKCWVVEDIGVGFYVLDELLCLFGYLRVFLRWVFFGKY